MPEKKDVQHNCDYCHIGFFTTQRNFDMSKTHCCSKSCSGKLQATLPTFQPPIHTSDPDKFFAKVKTKFGQLYDMSQSIYNGCCDDIVLFCTGHLCYFTTTPEWLLHKDSGICPDCHDHKKTEKRKQRDWKNFLSFVQSAHIVHNFFYDYSSANYINSKTKVNIICPIHGIFHQSPGDHINKKAGCQKCGLLRSIQANKISDTDILDRMRNVHNNKYTYPNLKGQTTMEKIDICCPFHGVFHQNLNSHLLGVGCPKCANERISNALRSDTATFIAQAILIHGSIYDYSLVDYKGNKIKVRIICPKHSYFDQAPCAHLNGCGCPDCGYEKAAAARTSSNEEFIGQAIKIHGNLYDYSLVDYKDAFTKVDILCSTHKKFPQKPNAHLNGHGCPKCHTMISGQELEWLKYIGVPDDKQHRQVKIDLEDKYILVDGFDPDTNTVYEFHGDFWHGNPICFDQNKTNYRSKKTFGELYKNTLAREVQLKQAGYNLITIWETDWQKIKKQIKQASKENKPTPPSGV